MVDTGYWALCLCLVAAAYSAAASAIGGRRQHLALIRSGENALLAVGALLTFSLLSLWYALLTHDFQVQYVAEHSTRDMPTLYLIAAVWGGQHGSLLFWSWLLALYGAAVVLINRHRYRTLMPYVTAVLGANSFFFALLQLFAADPFKRLPFTPLDGRGLNPLLQHPLMASHPPTLYLGMIGMVVPFAFAIAALASRQLDNTWVHASRRWMLFAWTMLSAGLLLGGKWAYVLLGWGGYWGWDPVENVSLIPWFSSTAFLHSIMVQQRRGMLKVWNMVLAMLTYILCIFGTFLTRTGLVTSVHAFAQSNVGAFFTGFLALLIFLSLFLLFSRLRELKADNRLESLVSRETAFLFNNWLLLGLLFAVLWGTTFPLLSELLTGTQITVGPPFFERIAVPIGLVLLLLTGIGPLFAWRRTSPALLVRNFALPLAAGLGTAAGLAAWGIRDFYPLVSLASCALVAVAILLEFYQGIRVRQHSTGESYALAFYRLSSKYRRRYGGYVIHFALVLLFIGFTGEAFVREREFVLTHGESFEIADYSFTYETLAHREDADKAVDAAALTLKRRGQFLGTLLPERRFYKKFDQQITEVSIYSTIKEDLYLVLVGYAQGGQSAKFHLFLNPLVNWVWVGGWLLLLGSLWAWWPTVRDRRLATLDRRAVEELSLPSPAVGRGESAVSSS